MLNRKVSNYLFYAVLVVIVGVILLVRSITLGNIGDKIDQLKVEEYKDIQINHLYELYDRVPNHFSQTELTYFTIAQLESIGVDESVDFQRAVYVDTDLSFPSDSPFGDLQEDFQIVEVQVYFTSLDTAVIEEFIDLLYVSEQVFIVNSIEYTSPDGYNYIGATINFYAFYVLEEEIEEAS